MARINTNVPSLVAQFNLARTDADLDVRLNRLATGLRINRGADDPAGLIISERIGTDLAGIDQAIKNGERASSVIATTEASLGEVTQLLNEIKGLMVEAANTGGNSKEERDANQLAIDSAIQSITRISNTASFGGLRLLDGSLDYITSGVNSSELNKAQVFGASFIGTDRLQVEVDVINSAQKGGLYLHGNGTHFVDGVVTSSSTFQISGSRGVQEISVPASSTITDFANAINQRTALTGVTANVINSALVFQSEFYGANEFVSVIDRTPGRESGDRVELYKFANNQNLPDLSTGIDIPTLLGAGTLTAAQRDAGRDVVALVNGSLANGDGTTVSINSTSLSVELDLAESFAVDPTATNSVFDITGGGSLFQLGPEVNAIQQANIGVRTVAATQLGGVLKDGSLQFLSSLSKGGANAIESNVQGNDFSTASDIIDQAIDEITVLRGRLGAFERNTLDTNRRSLQSSFENLTASKSVITDADFAVETSNLTRAQILQSSGTTVLGLANQRAQSVLQLLG
ncbi:MAG: flagellin [Planctomycetota bacterium]